MNKKMDYDSNWKKRERSKKKSKKIKQKQGREHHGFWEVSYSKGTAYTHAEIAQKQTPASPSCHPCTDGLSKWGSLSWPVIQTELAHVGILTAFVSCLE